MLKKIIMPLSLALLTLLTACASSGGKEDDPPPERKKTKNQLAWSDLQKKLEEDNRKKRLDTRDTRHRKLDGFEVFPGRGGSRSERMYEDGVKPVPTLW